MSLITRADSVHRHTPPRSASHRRRAVLVVICVALLSALVLQTPARAETPLDHLTVGVFDCPGNQMRAFAPRMTSLTGAGENIQWWPQVQKWNGSAWVGYRSFAGPFAGAAGISGSPGWATPNGFSNPGRWAWDVQPGTTINGTYYPTYYRIVSWVRWLDFNNNALTGWMGAYVSPYVTAASATYCAF